MGFLIAQIVLALLLIPLILGVIAYLILLERKTAAWIQDRVGPNRVGPGGLLQPIADGVKFILKEEFIPAHADKALYFLAPVAIMTPALCGFSVIPWGGVLAAGSKIGGFWGIPAYTFPANWPVMVANMDIGFLVILALASMAVYGVVLGGYASGSKFSFLGGLRATAQMLSYEIPLGLAFLTVAVVAGSLNLSDIAASQATYFDFSHGLIPKWNLFLHPVAFIIFVTCIFAEANRTPFDLAECENELVGGYHTEYSSMKFALFFLAEYSSMITGSVAAVVLFAGGWHLPWFDHLIYGAAQPLVTGWGGVILKFAVIWAKTLFFLFLYMWVRWTLPRFRFDQLMGMAWKGMIPLSLAAFVISAVGVWMADTGVLTHTGLWLLPANIVLMIVATLIVKTRPPTTTNRRIPIPGSRYNPVLSREAAAALASA